MEIDLEIIKKKWEDLENEIKRLIIGMSLTVILIYIVFGIIGIFVGDFWSIIGVVSFLLLLGITIVILALSAVRISDWLNHKYPD